MKTQKVSNEVVCNVLNEVKGVMKSTSKARAAANKEYASLSNVLKQIKAKTLWGKGFAEAFAAVGITDKDALTPAMFRELAPEVCAKDRKGKKQLAVWGMTALKDSEGEIVCDEEDNPILVPVQRIVKAWTPNKVLQILAQSAAFRAHAEATANQELPKAA